MNLAEGNLTIRNASADDAELLCAWWNDGAVMAHAGFPNGLGTTADQIRKQLQADSDASGRRHIIEHDGKPIGEMNYRNLGNRTAIIGIKICDFSEQNHGYGTILLSMFIDALFRQYAYQQILLDTNLQNTRAQRVYEQKLGFRRLRVEQDSWRNQLGELQSQVYYSLDQADWLARNIQDHYTSINARTIDKWADDGWEWSLPISHEQFVQARNGIWSVVLTPIKPVPQEWFAPFIDHGRLDGVKLLGLASGGGQQMPIFAAAGADCTVLDYSNRQLDRERQVAAREGYSIDIVQADMTKRLPFADESFDLIFHPVSNCYIEDVYHVWNECFRVLKSGGVLLAGLDNGFNFLIDDFTVRPLVITHKLPYNPLKMDAEQRQKIIDNHEGLQFSHTLEEQIGGQLKAGFILQAVYEDFNNDPDAVADGIPSYWATRAMKIRSSDPRI